jgi:hypothetical protein
MYAMYYVSMLRWWQFIRILVRTNHPCLRVGRHIAGLPCLQSRLGVPCTPLCSPGALVRQVEELKHVFHLVGGQLLENLLISDAISKATTTKALEMQGMVFQAWENRWMKDRSDFPGRYCTTWRSTSLPG